MNAEQTVETLVDRMNELDWQGVYALLDENVKVHNMPLPPLEGLPAVREFYDGVAPAITACDWQMLHIVSHGGLVLTERLDNFVMAGKEISLPVMGTFQVSDADKIVAWRDYFDLKCFESQLGGPLGG